MARSSGSSHVGIDGRQYGPWLFPALNIVADSFIELIRRQRVGYKVTGFEELAYKMGLESKI